MEEEVEFINNVIAAVNVLRSENQRPDLIDIRTVKLKTLSTIFNESYSLAYKLESGETDEEAKQLLFKKFKHAILTSEDMDAEYFTLRQALLTAASNHIDVMIHQSEGEISLKIVLYNFYLEVDRVSPAIDGDYVIEGKASVPGYGPAYCQVEYAEVADDKDWVRIGEVKPWEMLITDHIENAAGKFAVWTLPIRLPEENHRGNLRITVMADKIDILPYGEADDANFNPEATSLIKVLEYTTKAMLSTDEGVDLIMEAMEESQSPSIDGGSPQSFEGLNSVLSPMKAGFADASSKYQFDFAFEDDILDALMYPVEGTPDKAEAGTAGPADGEVKKVESDGDKQEGKEEEGVEKTETAEEKPAEPELTAQETEAGAEEKAPADGEGGGAKQPTADDVPLDVDEDSTKLVVQSIKLAVDYDEIAELRSNGYELQTIAISASEESGAVKIEREQDFLWRFFVMYKMGPVEEGGIEDIVFCKIPKFVVKEEPESIPSIPGYALYSDLDLSNAEDETAVFLATRSGPYPRYTSIKMITSAPDNHALLRQYITSNREIFRRAPQESMKDQLAGFNGLSFKVSKFAPAAPTQASNAQFAGSLGKGPAADGDADDFDDARSDISKVTEDTNLNDEDDVDESFDESAYLDSLQQRLDELIVEKQQVGSVNNDLQRKAANLLAREKSLLANSTLIKNPANVAETASLDEEQRAEKERLFHETLGHIADGRAKMSTQTIEFDQLASDLHIRLEDKLFKASNIEKSFSDFKTEILSTAVNSRTGKVISRRLISQFETIESQKGEELQKVRLKNILLRMKLKKAVRLIRSKEQLEDGLHMIDFEQLKIENQTHYEKIEERNEELSKLNRKKTNTVQVLTHIREKLRFIEKSNARAKAELEVLEDTALDLRANLAAAKRDRDAIKGNNVELRRRQGFVTSDLLVSDFESRKSAIEDVRAEIRELQNKYHHLAKTAEQMSRAASRNASRPTKTKFASGRLGHGIRESNMTGTMDAMYG